MSQKMKEKSKGMRIKTSLNLRKENNKLNKGITLIALVITIIVLLILAVVTIATLTGENGILSNASKAREETEKANAEEQVGIAVAGSIGTDGKINTDNLNDNLKNISGLTYNDEPISDSNRIGSLPAKVKVDGHDVRINANGSVVTQTIKEYTEDGVPIPEGFYYVGGNKGNGVVISDNPEDEGKGIDHTTATQLQGNQFVWAPVVDEDFERYDGYYGGALDEEYGADTCEEPYEEGYANEESEYNAMRNSVLEYNGFYVGRYEAGTTGTRYGNSGITDDVVVKQGKNVYNWIGWSDSDDMKVETGGAVQKSKEFASANNYTSVTSTLIYGVQWDAIMQFIDSGYKNEDGTLYEKNSFVANSTGKGNYTGSLLPTGSNSEYAVKNIYDLAGNAYEWTMESYNANCRVDRGRQLYQD